MKEGDIGVCCVAHFLVWCFTLRYCSNVKPDGVRYIIYRLEALLNCVKCDKSFFNILSRNISQLVPMFTVLVKTKLQTSGEDK